LLIISIELFIWEFIRSVTEFVEVEVSRCKFVFCILKISIIKKYFILWMIFLMSLHMLVADVMLLCKNILCDMMQVFTFLVILGEIFFLSIDYILLMLWVFLRLFISISSPHWNRIISLTLEFIIIVAINRSWMNSNRCYIELVILDINII